MTGNFGLVRRKRRYAQGNGALLVIVNTRGSYWDYSIVDETVIKALEHFGMPYRVLDLSEERLSVQALSGCAGIILAQNRLGCFLSENDTRLIADAVREGNGLVSFDCDICHYGSPLLEIFGFDMINPHPYATNVIRIRDNRHYISAMQNMGEYHNLDRMVTAIAVEKWRDDVIPLAEGILGKDQLVYIRHLTPWSAYEPRNYPLAFAARWGKGKGVQFTINSRLWKNEFFGHARGLDDLFWRSIVWAVRKPFAANIIPPYVTVSFDDCSGRHDFAYADACVRHGYVPMPSLFLRNTPERLFPKIKEGLESGKILYNTHAIDYYHLMYRHYGKGNCTADELNENFAYEDGWWDRVGARPGKTIRAHMGEYGANSLPFLKERGRTFFCPGFQAGLNKAEMCMNDGFWPYNLQNMCYDYLPDDNDFYVYAAFLKRFSEDFLAGSTAILRESEYNDVEKAARNAAFQIQQGLRAGFHAEMVTHEQKFDVLSLDEWERILTRIDQLTSGYEKIYAGHDYIGCYLKGKDGIWIENVSVEGGNIICSISGKTDTCLKISVFDDEDDGVVRGYRTVDAFTGKTGI